jgi:hypothetical protein
VITQIYNSCAVCKNVDCTLKDQVNVPNPAAFKPINAGIKKIRQVANRCQLCQATYLSYKNQGDCNTAMNKMCSTVRHPPATLHFTMTNMVHSTAVASVISTAPVVFTKPRPRFIAVLCLGVRSAFFVRTGGLEALKMPRAGYDDDHDLRDSKAGDECSF